MKPLLLAAALLALLIVPARGENSHNHPPQDADLHETFYSKWRRPNGGNERKSSCCNMEDCYAIPIRFDPHERKWYALRREDQQWVVIPLERLEQMQVDEVSSPDHQSHACIAPPTAGDHVICATLGTRSEQ